LHFAKPEHAPAPQNRFKRKIAGFICQHGQRKFLAQPRYNLTIKSRYFACHFAEISLMDTKMDTKSQKIINFISHKCLNIGTLIKISRGLVRPTICDFFPFISVQISALKGTFQAITHV